MFASALNPHGSPYYWAFVGGATGLWVFPAAVRVAVWAMFIGGQLLAGGVRGEQRMAHRKKRRRSD
jgi:hypothetical protein